MIWWKGKPVNVDANEDAARGSLFDGGDREVRDGGRQGIGWRRRGKG